MNNLSFKLWLESLLNPYHKKRRDYEIFKHNPEAMAKDIEEHPDDIWYHGTTADFDEFKTHGIKRTTIDWNAKIGIHFTSNSSVAHEFASGLYKDEESKGRVYAARLHLNNPKQYDNESGIANEAVAVAYKKGIITKSDFNKVLTSKKTRSISSYSDYDKFLRKNEPFEKVFPESSWKYTSFGFDVMYVASSNKKSQVANEFKKYLISQGYDSIIYENIVEKPNSTCIIVFDPSKIEIVSNTKI
jgi:hypothetical protein